MLVFHGSNMEVTKPMLIVPFRGLDFGIGFYTAGILYREGTCGTQIHTQ
jgi:hypothetical protein